MYTNAQFDGMEEIKGVDIQNKKYNSEKKGLSIEIQMDIECDLGTCAGTIMHITEILITQWTNNKVINGVYDTNGELINDKYDNLDNWAIEPKITKHKKYVSAETILEVYTNVLVHALYKYEQKYCDSNHVQVQSKNIIMEYTKKSRIFNRTMC